MLSKKPSEVWHPHLSLTLLHASWKEKKKISCCIQAEAKTCEQGMKTSSLLGLEPASPVSRRATAGEMCPSTAYKPLRSGDVFLGQAADSGFGAGHSQPLAPPHFPPRTKPAGADHKRVQLALSTPQRVLPLQLRCASPNRASSDTRHSRPVCQGWTPRESKPRAEGKKLPFTSHWQRGNWGGRPGGNVPHAEKKSCESAEKTERILDSMRTQSKTWKMLRDREEIKLKKKKHHHTKAYFTCLVK